MRYISRYIPSLQPNTSKCTIHPVHVYAFDMHRSRVLLLVCVLIYTVLLVVFYSTADVGEGRAAVLVQLRDANAHVQEPTQVRGKSVVAREAGGGALRAEAASSIHVSVKTTAKLHKTRLVVIMLTWMRTVPDPAQVSTC